MNFFLVRLLVWFVTLALYPIPVTLLPRSFEVEVLQCISFDALPQERPLQQIESEQTESEQVEPDRTGSERTERVLAYLEQAEKEEIDPWLREDIRIAWITTLWSHKGVPDWSWHRDSPPYVAATYQVLRCRPEEVWPHIVARRKELFGAAYDRYYDDAGNRIPEVLSPKKPCASERRGVSRKKPASRDLAA